MSTGSAVAVYFIIWWVTLFAVLPFGVKSQREAGDVSPGSDPGAPAVTRIGRIVLINSVAAAIGFAAFYYFLLPELP
jgi:predicted secreted protein